MVHSRFPGSALISQLFRQLTKPMSQRIVKYAARHPIFRRYFLLAPGRMYHRLEASLIMLKSTPAWIMNGTKRPELKRITDKEAVEIGSQLMIEVIMIALLTGIMVIDWKRSQRKSAEEEERQQLEFEELETRKFEAEERVKFLEQEIETARAQLRELSEPDVPELAEKK